MQVRSSCLEWRYNAPRPALGARISRHAAQGFQGSTLCQESARRIQNLELTVVFGNTRWYVPHHDGQFISSEDHDLYRVRDYIRKLVELIANGPVSTVPESSHYCLKRLTVKPVVGNNYGWKGHELLAALSLVLEPLQGLTVELPNLEDLQPTDWSSTGRLQDHLVAVSAVIVKSEYSKFRVHQGRFERKGGAHWFTREVSQTRGTCRYRSKGPGRDH